MSDDELFNIDSMTQMLQKKIIEMNLMHFDYCIVLRINEDVQLGYRSLADFTNNAVTQLNTFSRRDNISVSLIPFN